MPVADRLYDEHLETLRREEQTRQLPVVVVSIYEADAQSEAAATAAGVSDWLTKPIDGQRLLAAVHRVLPPEQAAVALVAPTGETR